MADSMTDTDDQRWSFKQEIGTLKDDMRAVRADLAALVEKGAHSAKDEVRDRAHILASPVIDAAKALNGYRESFEDQIRDHPLAAVGLALVAGMVITSMSRR